MRLLPLLAAAVLFGSGAAHAQSAMTGAGMGTTSPLATSPLGILGSSASGGSNSTTGIPLGATEIDPGGLSPAPISNCNTSDSAAYSGMSSGMTGLSGSGMASMPVGSAFDGGGFDSTTSSACASTSASASSAPSGGLASPLSSMGTNSNFTLNGGTIPLGSTEIDSAGVSPLITTPMSNSLLPSCVGSTTGNYGPTIGSMSAGTSAITPGC
jgi:hypothetical protein